MKPTEWMLPAQTPCITVMASSNDSAPAAVSKGEPMQHWQPGVNPHSEHVSRVTIWPKGTIHHHDGQPKNRIKFIQEIQRIIFGKEV